MMGRCFIVQVEHLIILLFITVKGIISNEHQSRTGSILIIDKTVGAGREDDNAV